MNIPRSPIWNYDQCCALVMLKSMLMKMNQRVIKVDDVKFVHEEGTSSKTFKIHFKPIATPSDLNAAISAVNEWKEQYQFTYPMDDVVLNVGFPETPDMQVV